MANDLKNADINIIVCGGGPAGLVAALSLKKNGFNNVIVLEKRSKERYFQDVGGGYDLGPATNMIMDELEVDEYLSRTYSLPSMSFHTLDGQRFREISLPQELGIRSTRRSNLQKALLNKLGEEFIRFDSAVKVVNDVKSEDGNVQMEVTIQNGEVMRCDLVIGAEGLHSQVRAYVLEEDAAEKIHDVDAMLYWGTVPTEEMKEYLNNGTIKPNEDMAPATWVMGPNANAAMYLLGDGENVWVLMMYEGQEDRKKREEKAKTDKEIFNQQERSKEEQREWWVERVKQDAIDNAKAIELEPLQQIIQVTPAHRIAGTPLQDLNPFTMWHKKQAILIGDAAHAVTPFIGQGANMAIADAHVLSLLLKKNLLSLSPSVSFSDALKSTFVEYENLRVENTNHNLLESRTWGDWMVSPSQIKAWIMKGAMWLFPTSMIAQQYLDYDQVNKDAIAKARGEESK